ncbi:Uncharacterised protein [uncultured archaeon]|nr:Uncharacterised protein [uncultured archaeon]
MDNAALHDRIFSSPQPFCYRWAWLSPSQSPSSLGSSSYALSSPDCAASFSNLSALRSLQRGAWREGRLQFLLLQQAPLS